MSRSDIWLSDLLYSIERLSIRDPAVVRQVLQMLKLDQVQTTSTSLAAGHLPPSPPPLPLQQDSVPTPPTQKVGPSRGGIEIQRISLLPVPVADTQSQLPQWYARVHSLQRKATPPEAPSLSRPLFPIRQSRALLSAALATWDEDGSPDIPRIIEILANGQPIRSLPQRTAPTLRRGCQVLVDYALSMAPFRLDVEHLITQIQAVAAKDRVEVRDFTGCPLRSGRTPAANEPTTWKPPARGTPILLLTDLGMGGPPSSEERASVGEWLEFAQAAQTSGCPVVALVPYAPSRWPRAFSGRMTVIHWDRRVTAARIRKQTLSGRRTS